MAMSSGVALDDGTTTHARRAVNVVADEPGRTVLEMTLKEGKNRQIRRMCEAVGLEVVRLQAAAPMGAVKLGMLQPGHVPGADQERRSAGLRAAAQTGKGRAQTRPARRPPRAARPAPQSRRKASAGRRRLAKSE